MEIQKIQKCMFLNLKLPKFCLKWLIFPRFFLASYSSRGIPRIEIPHSSFLIEGLTSLVERYRTKNNTSQFQKVNGGRVKEIQIHTYMYLSGLVVIYLMAMIVSKLVSLLTKFIRSNHLYIWK